MLPNLSQGSLNRTMVDVFSGYNANLRCNEGELSEMRNMTSDYYPVLSPRRKRSVIAEVANPQGIICKDALGYIDGENLIYSGKTFNLGLSTNAEDCPKQLISMGAYLLIFPDKKYFNTVDISDYGDMEAHFISQKGETTTYTMCNASAVEYENVYINSEAPEEKANGDYWLDISGETHALKVWSDSAAMWVSVATTYIKIQCEGIGKQFLEGDGVKISGSVIEDLNNTMVIQMVSDNYIVVIGILGNVVSQTDELRVSREVPVMEFVTEANNRIWGCHYGIKDGETVNEIYACKLGDFRNWNSYAGISTDSYAVTVGSDGVFTGAITHLGYPLFFKENCIHKIYGNAPSNYQVATTQCRGVQKGSYRSLAIVNEILYYKSATDICAYDGALPQSISSALGSNAYLDAIGGSYKGKYYLSMKNNKGENEMLVYDTYKGLWHIEDNTKAVGFAMCDHLLYYLNEHQLVCVEGSTEENFEWMATTGVIGYEYPDMKYVSRFNIRMKIEEGTKVEVFTEYDSDGVWHPQGELIGKGTTTFTLPVIPIRCDHVRIRIVGQGECKIFSLAKILEIGSDVPCSI